MPLHVCLSLFVCMYSIYLQGGDSVIVQSSHLFPRQGVSCLVTDLKTCVELQHVQQLQRWGNKRSRYVTQKWEQRWFGSQCAFIYVFVFASVSYLAEEVTLLLSTGEAGQVAADHQVRVIQHCVEPTPGGQQGLETQDTIL